MRGGELVLGLQSVSLLSGPMVVRLLLGKLMEGVVQNGTASALNGRGYTVAGKTGSAEYDENGSSHSWFIGYSNVDKPDLVVAIIVEGGGTGSEAAVPIAADLFDAYYFD